VHWKSTSAITCYHCTIDQPTLKPWTTRQGLTYRRNQSMKTSKVPQHKRLSTVSKLFGVHFPFRIEPMINHLAGTLCHDYQGGYWHFVMIDDAGFFMYSETDARFVVSYPNQYFGTVSAEAFGLIRYLYCYSALSPAC